MVINTKVYIKMKDFMEKVCFLITKWIINTKVFFKIMFYYNKKGHSRKEIDIQKEKNSIKVVLGMKGNSSKITDMVKENLFFLIILTMMVISYKVKLMASEYM